MATFQVSYSSPRTNTSGYGSQQASTSHVHLSGYLPQKRRNDDARNVTGTPFYDLEDDDDDDQMDVDGMHTDRADSAAIVTTSGQAIASASTFMRGHGAYLSRSAADSAPLIRSSLCGLVRKTNKLISVTSLKTRYAAEVGDLVVGRITDLQPGNRRWKVDVQARQEANLMLSSINLPGGIQRRKLDSDELEMRTFFKEGDLLVCEVQSLFHDGSMSLHTRSLNYGKLRNGQLALVNPCLIRRLKSHFVRMEAIGLEIIIGLNGVIWVSMLQTGKVNISTGTGRDIEAIYSDRNDVVPTSVRRRISRMLDIVALFSLHQKPISDSALAHAFNVSVNLAPLNEEQDDATQADNDRSEVRSNALTNDICTAILDSLTTFV